MRLDRSTYEAWLLDRLEGTLTPGQERELDEFLLANPDLPTEEGDLPHVDGAMEEFPMKEKLLRKFPPSGAPDAWRLNDLLVARLEGALSAEQERRLEQYLLEHPEAARDAFLMSRTKLVPEALAFDGKARIKRHFPPLGLPDGHRLTDFLIAGAEGDLGPEQRDALEQYLHEHPSARREQELVAATFVKREALAYPGKDALKKQAVRVVPLWPKLAAAASIALLLGAGWWLLREEHPVKDAGIAQVEHVVPREVAGHTRPGQPVAEDRTRTTRGEATGAQRDRPDSKVGTETPATPQHMDRSLKEQPSTDLPRHADQPLAVLHAIHHVERAPLVEQTLALAPGATGWTLAQAPVASPEYRPAASTAMQGEDLGVFLANRMRSDLLDAPRRNQALDGSDALAMADKAIAKITGGQGGVDVQQGTDRERILVRLGRGFSLSTSHRR